MKETLRFVLAEIGSLRKSVQEIEAVKSRLGVMETLQMEMESLSTKFQEMSYDYIGMTQQVPIDIIHMQSELITWCIPPCSICTHFTRLQSYVWSGLLFAINHKIYH